VKTLSQFVAKLSQNIQFVAGVAHFFCAAYAVSHSGHYRYYAAGAFVVLGGIKEFYFDARDEVSPPQTFVDNLEDFVGWLLGAAVGLLG